MVIRRATRVRIRRALIDVYEVAALLACFALIILIFAAV